MIYIPSLMIINSGIKVTEGYYPNNLRGFNVGIIEGWI
jgi:hypothetical protein